MSYAMAVQKVILPVVLDLSAGTVEWKEILAPAGARKFTVVDMQLVMVEACGAGDTGVVMLKHTPVSTGVEATKLTFTMSAAHLAFTTVKADTVLTASTHFDVIDGDTLFIDISTTASGAGTCYAVLYITELP
jgi:hypothetical protein